MSEFPDDPQSQIDQLLEQAEQLPTGAMRAGIIQEAVRLSDLTGNLELQYELRLKLVHEAPWLQKTIAIVAFAWCWAKSQEYPERFPAVKLLWEYKSIIEAVWQFPQVSNEVIEGHYQEMERAYREHGGSPQMVYFYRMDGAMYCGRMDEAAKYHELFLNSPDDQWSDCRACKLSNLIEYYVLLEDDQRVMDTAADLLNGRYSCAVVPLSTYKKLLVPLLRLRDPAQAMALHLKGYSGPVKKGEYPNAIGVHLQFLALTGNWDEGLKIFKKHLAAGWNIALPWRRWQFLQGADFFLQHYPAATGKPPTVRVPPEMKLGLPNKLVPLPEVAAVIAAETRTLAVAFDRRNGNRALQNELVKQQELWQYAVAWPLPEKRANGSKQSSPTRGSSDE